MSTYKIAVAKGDGIGPEVVGATLEILEFAQDILPYGIKLNFEEIEVGWIAFKKYGSSLPENSIVSIKNSDGLILGPLDVGKYPANDPGSPSPSGKIRKLFDLYANIRPTISYGLNPCYPEGSVDLVIVRENTEGFYADRNMYIGNGEFMPTKDVALAVRVISRKNCERIIKKAFELALDRKKKVTAVHKQNVLKLTDGLFLDIFREISSKYPDVVTEDKLVDAMAYDLLRAPQKYDVIVTTNMFGDILSDEAAGIAGSLGLAPSLNVGDSFAMAQAVHGSAPDIAGKGVANPIAELMSSVMLLEWIGKRHNDKKIIEFSDKIALSVRKLMREVRKLTPDLGGGGTTASIISDLKSIISEGDLK